ncbi:MAG: DNA replication/repair protein RecF [Christensenellaceae bacterium]|jgi:DNA replication and repair protein RecF
MVIKKIKLVNFRNYEQLDMDGFSDDINVVFGDNAQGKTNLLEAVGICANGKSFRVNQDAKTIRFMCDKAYLFVEYLQNGQQETDYIEVLIEKNKRKGIKKNGVPLDSMKQLLGNLYTVVFSPEDIRMVREAPGLRRAFLDGEISKIRPSYIDALKKYMEIVAQKNAALRRKTKDMENILASFNEQLEGYIKIILKNRLSYVKKLNEFVTDAHSQISGGREKVEIEYKSTIDVDNIEKQLKNNIRREMMDGACLLGPHRDDLSIRVNGKDVRSYASQGQLRTLVLSIKIACIRLLYDTMGEMPVFLLDDVFSELDGTRKANLLRALLGIQVFLTTTHFEQSEFEQSAAHFLVRNGTVKKL